MFPAWQISKIISGWPREYLLLSVYLTFIPMFFLVPKRVHALRERLAHVSNCKRNVSKELVVLAVGDEVAALLNTIFFAQWLVIKLMAVSYIISSLAVALIGLAHWICPNLVLPIQNESLFQTRTLIGCYIALTVIVLFAMAGQGILQSLVGLDSSAPITPAPIGKTEFATINWVTKTDSYKLRHSGIHEIQEAIDVVIKWLEELKDVRGL